MERLVSISFSRALIKHPESIYQNALTNHIQRSLVLESSFNFERVIFLFKWQSKVPSCSLSHCPLLVLASDVDTEVTETESNSLLSDSIQTVWCPVSVRHSISAFKEVVDLKPNHSSPGSPFSECNYYCCDGGTSDSFPPFLELTGGIVQPYWCLDKPWRSRLHPFRSLSSSNRPMVLSLISSYLLLSFSQHQGLELSFNSSTFVHSIYELKCSIQAQASSSVKPSPANQ